MDNSRVDIALVYPELLGTYGDRGNALVLQRRCLRRGIAARVLDIGVRDQLPSSADIYVLGGGEDTPQLSALELLRATHALSSALERGAALFAVCAGFQIIGRDLPDRDGRPIAGLGLLDAHTWRASRRLVGEVAVHPVMLGIDWIAGFENHRGITSVAGTTSPLGPRYPVIETAVEGATLGRIVATYLHGPVLACNPELADRVLQSVTGPLDPLADHQADALHQERLTAILGRSAAH